MFGRKEVTEAAVSEDQATPEPQPGDVHVGGVCFREGFYYPILYTEEGAEIGPDNAHPLIWVEATDTTEAHYAHAAPTDANHFHRYAHLGGITREIEQVTD